MNGKYFFILIISVLVLLSGCAEKTIPLTSGGLVTVDAAAAGITRVISTAPSNTEIIAGLGMVDKLIAVDKYSKDIAGVQKNLPEIDFFYPDIEAISGLKPDIIIASEINTEGRSDAPYQFLKKLGIEVIQIPTANTIEEIYGSIILIAQALGVSEKGTELVREMRKQIEETTASVQAAQNGAGKKSVYFEVTPAPSIVSFGRGTYLNELIEILGCRNIFSGVERWFSPSPEAIIHANPDIIFILSIDDAEMGGMFGTAEELKSRPGFQSINAVQRSRIYSINANYAARPSQNIVLALEAMYQAIFK